MAWIKQAKSKDSNLTNPKLFMGISKGLSCWYYWGSHFFIGIIKGYALGP